jgi:hypothetical protein
MISEVIGTGIISELIIIAIIAAVIFIIIKLGKTLFKIVFGIIINSILGVILLLLFNYFLQLNINVFSLVLVPIAIFGLPATGTVILLKLLAVPI